MLNALTTGSLVRSEGNFKDVITDTILFPYIERASWKVSGSLNDYPTLLGQVESGSGFTRADKAQKAETFFALAYSIVPLNSRTQEGGGMIKSVGWGEGKEEILSFDEAQQYATYYQGQGEELLFDITSASASSASSSLDYVTDGNIFYGAI
jgi:hypothetical protein